MVCYPMNTLILFYTFHPLGIIYPFSPITISFKIFWYETNGIIYFNYYENGMIFLYIGSISRLLLSRELYEEHADIFCERDMN